MDNEAYIELVRKMAYHCSPGAQTRLALALIRKHDRAKRVEKVLALLGLRNDFITLKIPRG